MPYSTNPYPHFIRSLKLGQPYSALISICAVLSDFLPLRFANIPFNRVTTYKAHLACTWASIAILIGMDIVIIGTIITLLLKRPPFFVDVKLLKDSPLAIYLALNQQVTRNGGII